MIHPAIEVADLTHSYPQTNGAATLRVPRFLLAAGTAVALRGESGCGKTTFLHLLAGLLRPDTGTIQIAGESMTAGSEAHRDRRRARLLGLVFQSFNLLQGFTVAENLFLAQSFAGRLAPDHARALLERLEIAHCADRLPRQLSTGQQQRVALARALVNRPALVLADEPTSSLDNRHAAHAVQLLRDLCTEQGAALLLVTHDERALVGCERVLSFAELTEPTAAACAP
jgi:ABC-type lipoprotein export system ATPase subunit